MNCLKWSGFLTQYAVSLVAIELFCWREQGLYVEKWWRMAEVKCTYCTANMGGNSCTCIFGRGFFVGKEQSAFKCQECLVWYWLKFSLHWEILKCKETAEGGKVASASLFRFTLKNPIITFTWFQSLPWTLGVEQPVSSCDVCVEQYINYCES